jgi:hypothetical protein
MRLKGNVTSMKKTSFIILTLVASFSVTMSVAQTDSLKNNDLSDFIYEPERLNTTPIKVDSNKRDTVRRDTVAYVQAHVYYNYYYRSRFWNGFYRAFAPRRYYRIINAPGYRPRHLRIESSHIRSGFGRTGSFHSVTN